MQDPTGRQAPPPAPAEQDASVLAQVREWWQNHCPAALNDPTLSSGDSEDLIDFLLDLRAERLAAEPEA